MHALWMSAGVVALAEMGDKTQLLALLLAARFRRPWPIVAGIVLATLFNHGLAGAVGAWLMRLADPVWLRWGLGVSFLAMAAWSLVPDQLDEQAQAQSLPRRFGVFGATLLSFFLAEMGDKTQFATIGLAAHYGAPILVVAGTTLGMLIADVPAVFLGHRFADRLPIRLIHFIAAALFAALGAATLLGVTGFAAAPR